MRLMERAFAAAYDRIAARAEDAGLRDRRAALLAHARGRVLEIGAGTGLNLPHYGDAVTEIVLTEPSPFMAKRLRAKLDDARARVVDAPAETLPFDDGAFDTVVSTLVLCSVEDPQRVRAEIERVLAPGGRLLVLEHVRSEHPGRARWQDRLERPWHFVGAGCHPNRDTPGLLAASEGLEPEHVERRAIPKTPPIVRPSIDGIYVRR